MYQPWQLSCVHVLNEFMFIGQKSDTLLDLHKKLSILLLSFHLLKPCKEIFLSACPFPLPRNSNFRTLHNLTVSIAMEECKLQTL